MSVITEITKNDKISYEGISVEIDRELNRLEIKFNDSIIAIIRTNKEKQEAKINVLKSNKKFDIEQKYENMGLFLGEFTIQQKLPQ